MQFGEPFRQHLARIFTGTATDRSFIFAKNQAAFVNTFAATYTNSAYDYCANVADQLSPVRVYYREADPTPVRNTTESTARSCRRILDADFGAQSGLYWLRELLATCGGASVAMGLSTAARNFLVAGTQATWATLSNPRVLAGSVANVPNSLWTGQGANAGFIVATNNAAFSNTFMASYPSSDAYDYCANNSDQASVARLYYREP